MSVEVVEGLLESRESGGSVALERRKVDEVHKRTNGGNNSLIDCTRHETQENLFHLLEFMSCPLLDTRDAILEVAKTMKSQHRCEPLVDFGQSNKGSAPLYQVVFEYAFVQLMQEIRCEAAEDVGVWEIFSEWINGL